MCVADDSGFSGCNDVHPHKMKSGKPYSDHLLHCVRCGNNERLQANSISPGLPPREGEARGDEMRSCKPGSVAPLELTLLRNILSFIWTEGHPAVRTAYPPGSGEQPYMPRYIWPFNP